MTTLFLQSAQMLDSNTSLEVAFARDRFAPLASESTVVKVAARRTGPQCANVQIDARLAPRLPELLAIVDLEPIGQDWDGYGGRPPTATAIKAALDLFGRHETVLGPPSVARKGRRRVLAARSHRVSPASAGPEPRVHIRPHPHTVTSVVRPVPPIRRKLPHGAEEIRSGRLALGELRRVARRYMNTGIFGRVRGECLEFGRRRERHRSYQHGQRVGRSRRGGVSDPSASRT